MPKKCSKIKRPLYPVLMVWGFRNLSEKFVNTKNEVYTEVKVSFYHYFNSWRLSNIKFFVDSQIFTFMLIYTQSESQY